MTYIDVHVQCTYMYTCTWWCNCTYIVYCAVSLSDENPAGIGMEFAYCAYVCLMKIWMELEWNHACVCLPA